MECKYFPITKDKCVEKQCAWYVSSQEQCSVLSVAEDLREIAEYLEESNQAD